VEEVEKHKDVDNRRIIYKEDVNRVLNRKYEEYIMDEVYMFKLDLVPLNQLILILLAKEKPLRNSFNADDIIDILFDVVGIDVSSKTVEINLRNLVMRFILEDTGKDNYRFALPIFPEILNDWTDERKLKRIIREVRKNA
jgi:hypothetical protein